MRSLFLKVFLWFWLAMALVIGALFLTTELTRERRPLGAYSGMDRVMDAFGQSAAATYEREGREGLARIFGDPAAHPDVTFYLFDESLVEMTGRDVPPEARDAGRRALARGGIARDAPGRGMFVGHAVTTSGGRRYAFVDAMRPRRGFPFSDNPAAQLLRVAAVLLTAGLLCYGLARYITSPVLKLRAVTRRVAGGDLSARVGPAVGERRDELGAMGRDFDEMAARIETLVGAQHRLVRDVSHELRSPLARLNVALDLARKRAGAEAQSALERIGREAARLNEMIGQLLTLARREGDGGSPHARVDLARLVREVAADADFEARSSRRSVAATRIDECETAGDERLLLSAVENVVRNSLRHTPAGTAVEVSLERAGDGAVISVRDRGPGVPDDALADIFRPFYRVDDARDRESGGTGLGLAITLRAVEAHGGTVAATNAPGGGLLVEMRLPVTPAPPARPT